MFCETTKLLSDAYILSAISDRISEGLQGQVRVVLIYAP